MVPVVPVAEINESSYLYRVSAHYIYCKLCTGHQSISELTRPIGSRYMSSHLPQDGFPKSHDLPVFGQPEDH